MISGQLLAKLPTKSQNLLFSETFSNKIKLLTNKLLQNPASFEVAPSNTAYERIKPRVYFVDKNRKR